MKLKVVCRKVYGYVRYDLKEIAFPSSLPDPPNVKKRPKATLKDWYYIVKEASRLYAASWVRDIGEDRKLKDDRITKSGVNDAHEEKGEDHGKEPSTLEDLAVAARGGMETLRPALQRLYMTRASVYRDALKNFVHGYQEGIQEVMGKNKDLESLQDEHMDKSGKSS